ncbi:MAG: hypothetical protein ACLPT4_05730 [Verrucomicrobiia bacterium]
MRKLNNRLAPHALDSRYSPSDPTATPAAFRLCRPTAFYAANNTHSEPFKTAPRFGRFANLAV